MTTEHPDKTVIDHGVATLWRYFEPLSVYVMVWPDEEPRLYPILRRAAFIPEGDGTERGPYLYLRRQAV